jgi:CBS domain-containing protein
MDKTKSQVKDWMTVDVITVPADMPVPQAKELMKTYNIRRLPVVEEDKLVGIVTLGDLREAGASGVSSLSAYEREFLLNDTTVGEVMTKDPVSVKRDSNISEAAKIMLDKKIGSLPVVDGQKVIGIISESDIFRVVVELFKE